MFQFFISDCSFILLKSINNIKLLSPGSERSESFSQAAHRAESVPPPYSPINCVYNPSQAHHRLSTLRSVLQTSITGLDGITPRSLEAHQPAATSRSSQVGEFEVPESQPDNSCAIHSSTSGQNLGDRSTTGDPNHSMQQSAYNLESEDSRPTTKASQDVRLPLSRSSTNSEFSVIHHAPLINCDGGSTTGNCASVVQPTNIHRPHIQTSSGLSRLQLRLSEQSMVSQQDVVLSSPRELAHSARDQDNSQCGHPISPRGHSNSPRDEAISPRNLAISPRDLISSPMAHSYHLRSTISADIHNRQSSVQTLNRISANDNDRTLSLQTAHTNNRIRRARHT